MTTVTHTHLSRPSWHRVDARYRIYLRVYQVIALIVELLVLGVVWWLDIVPWSWLPWVLLALIVMESAWSIGYLASRRYRRTQYHMGDWDITLQQGVLFWRQQSMSFNRVQHLVVHQGPLERLLGLASLSIYSAGTQGSDIRIPGLWHSKARQLKDTILETINAEPQESGDAS